MINIKIMHTTKEIIFNDLMAWIICMYFHLVLLPYVFQNKKVLYKYNYKNYIYAKYININKNHIF